MEPVHDEEQSSSGDCAVGEFEVRIHEELVVALVLVVLLNSGYLDCSVFLGLRDGPGQDLISCSDYLVQREVDASYEVVVRKHVWIVKVVDVIDTDTEHLLLFELVGYLEVLDPLWIQVVFHDLREA